MGKADIPQICEFLPGPYTATGVVGITEQEQLHVVLDNLLLKVCKVNSILAVVTENQVTAHELPVVVENDFGEGVVDWLLNKD